MLADAACILVHVTGGPGMTLSEVEVLMQELGRHVNEQTQILFGAGVDGRMGNRLSVTIISSVSADVDLAMDNAAPVAPSAPIWEQQPEPETKIDIASGRRGDTDSSRGEPEPIVMQEATAPPVGLPFEQGSPVEEIVPPPAPEIRKPEPGLIAPKKKPAPAPIKESKPVVEKVQAKQEVLQFEPVTRGRFEKSEPTIVEGQDLDVPTFLRKNVRVK
jgi:cell division protein FtsZ